MLYSSSLHKRGKKETGKEMGIWDFISWSTESVKGLWQSSYNHSCAAITKVDNLRVDAAEKVNQHLSDPETRSKVYRVATDVAMNASIEGLKWIPGAFPTYKIVSKSLSDDKKSVNENKSKEQEEDLKALQATVSRMEKEISILREQAGIQKHALEAKPQNTDQADQRTKDMIQIFMMTDEADQKAKDMIRVFMMKEFMGSHNLLGDSKVPVVGPWKNPY